MKNTLALIAAVTALTIPVTAQAHRGWLAPTSTVLSGSDAWVGFDAGMSNRVFIADHNAMRLTGLTITAPDGSAVAPENLMQGRHRSTFDAHLTQQGTYRIANVSSSIMATWKVDGVEGRWRGSAADFTSAVPAGAADVVATRASSRTETFVTLGAPTETVFTATAAGIELGPVTHPNALVVGEAATFRLMLDGVPAADIEVTVARGGSRYRNAPEEMTVRTGPDGAFSVSWPQPGLYWMNASVRRPAAGADVALNAQYSGVVEVLP